MCEPVFIPISAIRAPSFHPQNTRRIPWSCTWPFRTPPNSVLIHQPTALADEDLIPYEAGAGEPRDLHTHFVKIQSPQERLKFHDMVPLRSRCRVKQPPSPRIGKTASLQQDFPLGLGLFRCGSSFRLVHPSRRPQQNRRLGLLCSVHCEFLCFASK